MSEPMTLEQAVIQVRSALGNIKFPFGAAQEARQLELAWNRILEELEARSKPDRKGSDDSDSSPAAGG